MPIYTFYCDSCKKEADYLVKLHTEEIDCEECTSPCKRTSGFPNNAPVFKGSPFSSSTGL